MLDGPSNLTRRDILAAGLASCFGCALSGCGGSNEPSSAEEPLHETLLSAEPVDVGPLTSFNRDGIFDRWAESGFFIVRRNGRLFAPLSVCTHKSVRLVASKSDLGCPRHGSVFTAEGVIIKAPARQSLPRAAIHIDDRGHVIVEARRYFLPDAWNSAGASVAIVA